LGAIQMSPFDASFHPLHYDQIIKLKPSVRT